jgi:L-alanine-DL-glutamate epimerase-like enolase superfamily enzyme
MGNSFVRVYTDQGITGTGEMVNEVGAAEIINQSFSDIQPDMLKCGGLLETRKIAAMAEVYGIPIAPHGTATQLGKMAMSHICRHAHRHGEWRGGGRLGGSDVDQPRLDPPHAAEPHSLLPRGRRHVRQAANVDGQLAWRTQASHGHPSFSPDDRWVIYNSDAEKCDNVYMAEVHSL